MMKNYEIIRRFENDDTLCTEFCQKADELLSSHLTAWCQNGYWTFQNVPYAIRINGRIAAGALVRMVSLCYGGSVHECAQICACFAESGTGPENPAGILFSEIKKDWHDQCELIFSLKTDIEADGFAPITQTGYSFTCGESAALPRFELSPDSTEARQQLMLAAMQGNPYAAIGCYNDFQQLVYDCAERNTKLIYLPTANTVALMKDNVCLEILSPGKMPMKDILSSAALPGEKIILGFEPVDKENVSALEDKSSALLIYSDSPVSFEDGFRMPGVLFDF